MLSRKPWRMLAVPLVVLLVPELLLRCTSARRISLASAQAGIMLPATGQRLEPYQPDRSVEVVMAYHAPSLYSYFVSGPRLWVQESTMSAYLTDEKGKRYAATMLDGTRHFSWGEYRGGQRYVVNYPLRLSRIPASAGAVTFHAAPKVDEGYELPVSVVLRSH